MPVPVPVYSKPPAHPVIKSNRAQAENSDYVRHSVFRSLTNSLPQPPSGPPPAFASREEWISSLPSWRRNKPRRIWEEDIGRQGFQEGLAAAGNAAVIKGAPAQAGIPPISTLLAGVDRFPATMHAANMYAHAEEDADENMSPADSLLAWHGEGFSQFSDDEDMAVELASDSGSAEYAAEYSRGLAAANHQSNIAVYTSNVERGAFSPVYEEISPDNDPASSPICPNTPFGDYVDRAVAAHPAPPQVATVNATQSVQYPYTEEFCHAQCYQCQHYPPVEQVAQQIPPAPEPVVTPTASATYKKLAEPLADWMATFVWKVCTTGMNMPDKYAQPRYVCAMFLDSFDLELIRLVLSTGTTRGNLQVTLRVPHTPCYCRPSCSPLRCSSPCGTSSVFLSSLAPSTSAMAMYGKCASALNCWASRICPLIGMLLSRLLLSGSFSLAACWRTSGWMTTHSRTRLGT